MAKVIDEKPRPTVKERAKAMQDGVQGSQAWSSIFRPGSIFRKGYTDSPRNRSYVIMNSVLYHLHPVKVKRHAVKVSYTLYTYAAVQVWAQAAAKANSFETDKVAAQISGGTFDTVLGKLSIMTEKGDVKDPVYVWYQWHDGKYAEQAR